MAAPPGLSATVATARPGAADAAAELAPWQRLEALCDAGSLAPIAAAEEGGVAAAAGRVEGRPVVCFAQDGSVAGGSLGEADAVAICRLLELAARDLVPVVGFVESAGARMQDGVRSLDGYARVFHRMVALSGRVPQISIATGASAGGGCYCAALTDFTILTREARMFLTGPRIVAEVTGEEIAAEALGGARVHRRSGVCHLVAADARAAAAQARQLLAHLPAWGGGPLPRRQPRPPRGGDPGAHLPARPSSVYDMRAVLADLFDGGEALELGRLWAPNMLTALARLDGRPVGVIANQPRHRGGVIDVEAAQKAARCVEACTRFGLPLVVLVDTPGFMPGGKQEAAGIIRHGADLLHAFAAAAVPKLTVILRRAFGGGYIAMSSKHLGADLSLAWPGATIGVVGARQAVGLIHRAEIAAAAEPAARQEELALAYGRGQAAAAAARAGAIDAVVEPAATRARLAQALTGLAEKPPSSSARRSGWSSGENV
jgi:acetyl-CoA carboxylase carboxyltransferase component